jgi:hypothetical protein
MSDNNVEFGNAFISGQNTNSKFFLNIEHQGFGLYILCSSLLQGLVLFEWVNDCWLLFNTKLTFYL